jgi:hypothetical protein
MKHIDRLNGLRPAALLLLLGVTSALMFVGSASDAYAAKNDAITLTSPSNVTIAESDDYATQVLGNPWDMNGPDDLHWPHDLANISVSDSVWRANPTSLQGGSVHLQYQNFPNGYSYVGETDGVNYPVDANRFSRLWVRMSSDVSTQTLLWFFRHYSYTFSGNSNFIQVEPGWRIYSVDLRAGGGGGTGNWTQNGPYEGLRLDMPWFAPDNNVQIDWVRLTPDTGQSVNITWNYQGDLSSRVNLYLSYSPDATQGNEYLIANVAASGGQYAWRTTGIAPGTYYVHAEMNGALSSIGPLYVNTAPVTRIDAPSTLSGEDYAQARFATSWQGCEQFAQFISIVAQQCGSDVMQGLPMNNDPQAYWLAGNYSGAVDTSRYHYLNVKFMVAAPAARPWSPFNAGARILWANDTIDYTSNMILTPYNRWIQAAFDMRTVPIVEGGNGWSGAVSTLRFDPHEEDDSYGQSPLLPQSFQIDKSHITSEPLSGPGTIVRWTALQGGGTVDLYRDNNNSGFDGTLIASNQPISQGSYAWDTASLANGTYWVYIVAHDSYNQSRFYSRAPLRVDHSTASTLFSDVPTNHWAVNDVNRLAMLGAVSGSTQSDTTINFKPSGTAFRSHLSKMVTLAAGWQLQDPGTPTFNDVPRGHTFYTYIETAASHGVISGYDCGGPGEPCPGRYFRPGNDVTRAQTAKMISISRGWGLVDPSNGTFADVHPGDALYTHVETAYAHSIISGYPCGGAGEPCDGQNRPYFRPGVSVTRAQLSKMLARSLDSLEPSR